MVAELVKEIVPCMYGGNEIFRLVKGGVCRGKRPDNPGVQDYAPGGIIQDSTVREDFPVKTASGILECEPI
jgi:hypothetical protein